MILKIIMVKLVEDKPPITRIEWYDSKTIKHSIDQGGKPNQHRFELDSGKTVLVDCNTEKYKTNMYIVDNGKTIDSF